MADVLDDDTIAERLSGREGWELRDGALRRKVELADFSEAFGFMARVALVAEKMNHHPDWSNSWNTVDISIVNHAAGGITEADFELAAAIDAILEG